MSTPLPAHVGRDLEPETGCALVCGATPDGNPDTGAICGQPATHHLKWNTDGENGLSCDQHLDAGLGFGPVDVHGTDNGACGMPGAVWVDGSPSHCTMFALDDDPDRSGHAVLTAAEPTTGGAP